MQLKGNLNKIFKRRPHGAVLLYHLIAEGLENGLTVTPNNFKEQLIWLKKHFKVKAIQDFLQNPKDSITITFDDGYANNLHFALPILKELDLPATIFMTSAWFEGSREYWWDELNFLNEERKILKNDFEPFKSEKFLPLLNQEKNEALDKIFIKEGMNKPLRESFRPMNFAELEEIASCPLITIGAHTHDHLYLSAFSNKTQKENILTNLIVLEKVIGYKPELFAYPHGGKNAFNETSKNVLRELGIKKAFAAYSGFYSQRKDDLEIPRFHVKNISGKELTQKLRR